MLHYRFQAEFCNPASGNEKGNVENKVGTIRRNLFVPAPTYHDVEDFNRKLLDLHEQKAEFYRINRMEKWITYLMLCFILIIALFNVIGSLSMLILEKKEDAGILSKLGADGRLIRQVFLYEGWLIALSGAVLGIILGAALCLLQQHFGWLKLGDGNFIVSAYPVALKAGDLLLVLVTVLTVSLPSVWWPVHYIFSGNEPSES